MTLRQDPGENRDRQNPYWEKGKSMKITSIVLAVTAVAALVAAIVFASMWDRTRENEALQVSYSRAALNAVGATDTFYELQKLDEQMVLLGISEKNPEEYQALRDLEWRAFRASMGADESFPALKEDIREWGRGRPWSYVSKTWFVAFGIIAGMYLPAAFVVWVFWPKSRSTPSGAFLRT